MGRTSAPVGRETETAEVERKKESDNMNWRGMLETFTVTLSAIALSLVLFAIFILATKGVSPVDLYAAIYKGGFGTATSWENCLKLAAPLMLTALCTALPARLGLINIGGEGALILGGLAAAMMAACTVANLPFPLPQIMHAAGQHASGRLAHCQRGRFEPLARRERHHL